MCLWYFAEPWKKVMPLFPFSAVLFCKAGTLLYNSSTKRAVIKQSHRALTLTAIMSLSLMTYVRRQFHIATWQNRYLIHSKTGNTLQMKLTFCRISYTNQEFVCMRKEASKEMNLRFTKSGGRSRLLSGADKTYFSCLSRQGWGWISLNTEKEQSLENERVRFSVLSMKRWGCRKYKASEFCLTTTHSRHIQLTV